MLRPMNSKHPRDARQTPAPEGEQVPALPAWKAFVVQFSRETTPHRGAFSGRVEHISSGRRARFGTRRELLAVLGDLLGELGEK
jgi:hypothetical protein